MASGNSRLNNGRPPVGPGPQVGLQVATPMNDVQLVCLMAAQLRGEGVTDAVTQAMNIVEEAIARMGARAWDERMLAVKQLRANEDQEAETRRRAELEKEHPTIALP